jgi:hypothetical protein
MWKYVIASAVLGAILGAIFGFIVAGSCFFATSCMDNIPIYIIVGALGGVLFVGFVAGATKAPD